MEIFYNAIKKKKNKKLYITAYHRSQVAPPIVVVVSFRAYICQERKKKDSRDGRPIAATFLTQTPKQREKILQVLTTTKDCFKL